MNKRFWNISRDELAVAITDSKSIAGALRQLSLPTNQWHYKKLKDKCKELGIDTSHFLGQAWVTKENCPIKKPLHYFFSLKKSCTSTHRLKLRLIEEGIFQPCCVRCGLTAWRDLPIPLELNHIDGDRKNNQLSNFELLCPNCHAQTDTYRGKNKRKMVRVGGVEPPYTL